MKVLTLEIHDNHKGWLEAAELKFHGKNDVSIVYDLDYASEYERCHDSRALSLRFPVSFTPYRGSLPGFILDLIPQGDPLRKVLARHRIQVDDDYETILHSIPLASPGNIRIKQAWSTIESLRPNYGHTGFTADDISKYQIDFIEYMQNLGALIGGTTGAGGGSPKFLLREDLAGRFHAEGMLDDSKTKQAWLIKFPYTDSSNSIMLCHAEKYYYDIIRELPLVAGAAMKMHENALFIQRFDREKKSEQILYHGLESFYSAHGIAHHGATLLHEDNLLLIKKFSSNCRADAIEYLKRDILNQYLANTDNHGRNISFIKRDAVIRLSPIYDVTSMKFFKSEPITRLTRWTAKNETLKSRMLWIAEQLEIEMNELKSDLKIFLDALHKVDSRFDSYAVPREFIDMTKDDRENELELLAHALK